MKEAIQIAVQSGTPVLIWGAPGTGKTSYVQQLARVFNVHLETIVASLRDPTDFGGLPIKTSGDTVYMAPPRWARDLHDSATEGSGAWAFFDEITTAPPAVQAALLRVIHEGTVGDLDMHREVRMLAAANPPDQAAGGWNLAPPLANRFFHYNWSVSASEWAEGMVAGFPNPTPLLVPTSGPNDYKSLIPKHKATTSSFAKRASNNLLLCPEDETKAGKAWPSPRTWEMAANLMAANEAAGGGQELEIILVNGCVGDGAAGEFLGWLKSLDLPDPEVLLADPGSYEVADRSDKIYTTVTSVVGACVGSLTPDRYMAAWKILGATADAGHTDVGAAAARTLAQHANAKLGDPATFVRPFLPMLKEAGLVRERKREE